MLRIVGFAVAGLVALYAVWNFVQFLVGSYGDRRALKNEKGDGAK
jgi:hypothetical protein